MTSKNADFTQGPILSPLITFLIPVMFALLIQFLEKGTGQLGNSFPAFAVGAGNVRIGIVLFCIIGGAFFMNYRLVFRTKARSKEKEKTEVRDSDA